MRCTKYYELDEAYPGLFAQVAAGMDALTLARYRPDDYRLDEEANQRAQTLAGILRTGLLKRFESSVQAFRLTCQTMIDAHETFLGALDDDRVLVPASRRTHGTEADDPAQLAEELGEDWCPLVEYHAERLRSDVEADLGILRAFRDAVAGASIDNDPKLHSLSELLWGEMVGEEKAIIFTYYADTADWIEQALLADEERDGDRYGHRNFVVVTGTRGESPQQRLEKVRSFAPRTMIEEAGRAEIRPEDETNLLIATDVLAEGQNLQEARYIVNYDMPWNPMRLVQRNGRIDRLGSPWAGQDIFLFNLFPAGELESILKLYERLSAKIAHANISVGMEAPVFEDVAAMERNFADTAEHIRGIAREDVGILEQAEATLDAFSGEEFRMELRAALAAERLKELQEMPHGAGSGFLSERVPDGARGVFFGARLLLGARPKPAFGDERAWRYLDLESTDEPLSDELEILQRIRCKPGTPRELPDGIAPTIYELWERVQAGIIEEYERRLDPAAEGVRIPESQRWALDLLATQSASLADQAVPTSRAREAAGALEAPRGPLVRRRLSSLRRELKDGDITPTAAVLGVLEVVADEGLRPADDAGREMFPKLTADRVRLICYQVVHRESH